MTENDLPEKRGLTQQQAMAYVGAKRRTWEALWAPRLVAIKQGVCLIYDRRDLDRVFDQLKAEAASAVVPYQGPRTVAYPFPIVPREPTRNRWRQRHFKLPLRRCKPYGSVKEGPGRGSASKLALALANHEPPVLGSTSMPKYKVPEHDPRQRFRPERRGAPFAPRRSQT